MREFTHCLIAACAVRGIHIIVTNVARDVIEQAALFAQGRKTLTEVNQLRTIAGLPEITATENQKVVTWTMKSKHIIDRDNESLCDDFSRAVDIAVVRGDGKATWNLKADVNKNSVPDYEEVGRIALEVDPSVVWGGFWKKKDYPHFEEGIT